MGNRIIRGKFTPKGLGGRLWHGTAVYDAEEGQDLGDQLREGDVTVIWNIQELEQSVEVDRGIVETVIWTPIDDYQFSASRSANVGGIPANRRAFERDLDRVIDLLRDGTSVYVHCAAGKGRTGLAVGCLLVRLGVDSRQALLQAEKHTGGPETDDQKRFVEDTLPRG